MCEPRRTKCLRGEKKTVSFLGGGRRGAGDHCQPYFRERKAQVKEIAGERERSGLWGGRVSGGRGAVVGGGREHELQVGVSREEDVRV